MGQEASSILEVWTPTDLSMGAIMSRSCNVISIKAYFLSGPDKKCWHLNTSRWVRRPFTRQLLDTQACSYRRLVTADCQVGTRGKRPGHMGGWRGTILRDLMNERGSVLRGPYSVGTITPVNSGKSALMEIGRLSAIARLSDRLAGCEGVRGLCAAPPESSTRAQNGATHASLLSP